uniref:Uncharacterized protein n=1 Tax=Ditylenchus dipsaci TaxID=166011 RepID=A0A915ETA0_9BILA
MLLLDTVTPGLTAGTLEVGSGAMELFNNNQLGGVVAAVGAVALLTSIGVPTVKGKLLLTVTIIALLFISCSWSKVLRLRRQADFSASGTILQPWGGSLPRADDGGTRYYSGFPNSVQYGPSYYGNGFYG